MTEYTSETVSDAATSRGYTKDRPMRTTFSTLTKVTLLPLLIITAGLFAAACDSGSASPPGTATSPSSPQPTVVESPVPPTIVPGSEDYNLLPAVSPSEELEKWFLVDGTDARAIDGYLKAIAIAPGSGETMAYLGTGDSIRLANISDPLNIEIGPVIGRTDEQIDLIKAEGDLVAVATGDDCRGETCGGIELFRIGDDLSLTPFATVPGQFNSLEIDGDFLYLASYDEGIEIFLVEEEPELIATIPVPPAELRVEGNLNRPMHIYVNDGRMFVAGGGDGLFVFDVTSPWSPEQIAQYGDSVGWSSQYQVDRVATSGDTVLVLINSRSSTIYRIDISDLVQPVMTGSINPRLQSNYNVFTNLEITGDTAFYAGWFGDWISGWAVGLIDLSDPDELNSIGTVMQNGGASPIATTDEFAFVPVLNGLDVVRWDALSGDQGDAVSVGSEVPESIAATVDFGIGASTVYVHNMHAFVFTSQHVRVSKINRPGSVRHVSTIQLNGRGPAMIEGDTAFFFSDRSAELNTETYIPLDFSEPESPRWLDPVTRTWRVEGEPNAERECPNKGIDDVCYKALNYGLTGPYALTIHMAMHGGRQLPDVLVEGSNTDRHFDIATGDGLVFLAADNSVYIFDATDPHEPALIARQTFDVDPDAGPERIKVKYEDGLLFVLIDGLWVVDVQTPSEPKVAGYHDFDATELGVDGKTVALANRMGQLEVVHFTLSPAAGS